MKPSWVITTAAICLAGSIVVTGAAVAMVGRPSDNAVKPTTDRYRCFDPSMVRGFQTVDDHTLVVTSDWNQAYKLTLGGVCFGLDTTFAIGLKSRSGMMDVCGPFDADIIFRDDLGAGRHQQCPIIAMKHLTGDEAAPYVNTKHDAASSRR